MKTILLSEKEFLNINAFSPKRFTNGGIAGD